MITLARLTNSPPPSFVDLLRSILFDKYGIETTRNAANKSKEQSIIRIPQRQVAKVQQLLKPHIGSSMKYRVGL